MKAQKVTLLSITYGTALPQAGLATAERGLCGEEQRQVEATSGPPEGADATTAHTIGLHETICQEP